MAKVNKRKYYPKPIEKKHPSPKKPINPMKPPKESLNGDGRFHILPYPYSLQKM